MPTITVHGIPAPQGSKRAIPIKRGGVYTGKVSLLESAGDKVKAWRALTHAAAIKHEPILGPVKVVAVFYLPRPKGHFGTGRNAYTLKPSAPEHPAVKPDADKLLRSTLDALTTSGLIEDDARVISVTGIKRYASRVFQPGAVITITPWTGDTP